MNDPICPYCKCQKTNRTQDDGQTKDWEAWLCFQCDRPFSGVRNPDGSFTITVPPPNPTLKYFDIREGVLLYRFDLAAIQAVPRVNETVALPNAENTALVYYLVEKVNYEYISIRGVPLFLSSIRVDLVIPPVDKSFENTKDFLSS
jgi:hypothetical protein